MIVYVILKIEDYAESTIIGVYNTKEKAEAHVDDAYSKKRKGNYTTHYDYYPWEVE